MRVSNIITERLGNIFPDDPNIINNSKINNNPFNNVIPRISYNNEKYILNIAQSKVDFYFNNISKIKDYKVEMLTIFKELISIFKDDLKFLIHRIGIVANFSISKMKSFDLMINENEILSNTKEFNELNFSWLDKFNYKGTELNKWIRYIRNEKNLNHDFISIDINTLQEVNLHYRNANLSTIISDIINYIEEEI